MANEPAAGWYPDPKDPGQRRYWDGSNWTEHSEPQTGGPGQAPGAAATAARPVQSAAAAQPAAAGGPSAPQAPPAPQAAQAPQTPQAPQAPGVPPGGFQPVPPLKQPWTGAPLAGWGSRALAQIVDWILGLLFLWIGEILLFAGKPGIGLLLMFLGLIVAFLYYPLTMMREGEQNGQTVGKQMLNIRVSRDDGQQVNFGFAVLREFVVKYLLFQVIGGIFLGIPWLIDVLFPLWDDKNEALHDKIVKTHVVKA